MLERSGTKLKPILLTNGEPPVCWPGAVVQPKFPVPHWLNKRGQKADWLKIQGYETVGRCLVLDFDFFPLSPLEELASLNDSIRLAPPRPAIHRCNLGISLQDSDRFFREVSESVSSLDWQKEQRWSRVESLAARWYLDQGFQPLPREWSVYSVHVNDYLPSWGKAIHFAGGEQKHEMRNRLEKWGVM
ncbi:hypothetical protein GYB59_03565 [bacterium]|nr:hypothetical protein [bacterium]